MKQKKRAENVRIVSIFYACTTLAQSDHLNFKRDKGSSGKLRLFRSASNFLIRGKLTRSLIVLCVESCSFSNYSMLVRLYKCRG